MSLDAYLYDLSNLFLIPVQIGVVAMFVYSVFSLGMFITLRVQRRLAEGKIKSISSLVDMAKIQGHSMLNLMAAKPDISREDLEIAAHRELALLRITTRVAPMLGLVATMIPMGPALKSLANGNVQGISESLIIAFTAVIFALLAASITFWIASAKRDLLVEDIRFAEQWREANPQTNTNPKTAEKVLETEPEKAVAKKKTTTKKKVTKKVAASKQVNTDDA